MDSASDVPRPTISDGKTQRQIWRPEDGNGDAETDLFERTRFQETGHPTWKIYCGDAPEKVNGVLVEPPKSCYLDDRAAYKILNWDGFTKAERGRYWKHDYSSKGDLRPTRKPRGRPAFIQGGDIASIQGSSKLYRFSGAMDPMEIVTINSELATQRAGRLMMPMDPISVPASPKLPDATTVGIFASPAMTGALASQSSAQQKRPLSPMTSELVDSSATKKPRYGNASNNLSTDMPTTPRQAVAALQDRNKNLNEKIMDLQEENKHLAIQLESIQTLWAASSSELEQLRISNQTMRSALQKNAAGSPTEALALVLEEEKTSYRELAKHVYAKFKGVEAALQEGYISEAHKIVEGDLKDIQETMAQVLGADWQQFEKEV